MSSLCKWTCAPLIGLYGTNFHLIRVRHEVPGSNHCTFLRNFCGAMHTQATQRTLIAASINEEKSSLYQTNDITSYCNLYESRTKNLWFAHVVQQTSPHDDIQLAKIRSFVTVNRTIHFSSNMLPRAKNTVCYTRCHLGAFFPKLHRSAEKNLFTMSCPLRNLLVSILYIN